MRLPYYPLARTREIVSKRKKGERARLTAVRAGLEPAAPCSRSQVLERAKGGDAPGGGILEVVAWQPYLLSRAGESAQEGHKPSVGRVCCGVPRDSVVGDAEGSLVMRLVQAHVDPSAVLLGPCLVGFAGAFLQQGIGQSCPQLDVVVQPAGSRAELDLPACVCVC